MYTIKPVEEKNIGILSEIMARVFTEADPKKPWDQKHAEAYLKYWFQKQPDLFLGAFTDDGKPIGAMAVNIKPWRTETRCTDGIVFVDSTYQRQGIAKSLFKKVITEAMQRYNATGFEAITFAHNEFPFDWYGRLGINPDNNAVLIKGTCAEILEKLS